MAYLVDRAKKILSENSKVLYGIFGIVESSDFFPPRDFLNEFLLAGSDPCDQDGRMDKWEPFALNEQEYRAVLTWWQSSHPSSNENNLNSECWNGWVQELLENT